MLLACRRLFIRKSKFRIHLVMRRRRMAPGTANSNRPHQLSHDVAASARPARVRLSACAQRAPLSSAAPPAI